MPPRSTRCRPIRTTPRQFRPARPSLAGRSATWFWPRWSSGRRSRAIASVDDQRRPHAPAAAALIAVGLLGVVAGAGFSGLWLAFIGWFLLSAAAAEMR